MKKLTNFDWVIIAIIFLAIAGTLTSCSTTKKICYDSIISYDAFGKPHQVNRTGTVKAVIVNDSVARRGNSFYHITSKL